MCLNKSGGALKYQPAKCCKIVYVCCQSHNICVDMKLPVFDDPEALGKPRPIRSSSRLGRVT